MDVQCETYKQTLFCPELGHRTRSAQSDVRYVPIADIEPFYSITSSARASNDGGTARPSALAALRLMTRLSFAGC